jgi:serine/threonine-protein kinase
MKSRRSRYALPLACALIAGAPTWVHAQSAEKKAAAEALFDEGRKLMAGGDVAEACRKLEQSQRLDPGIGTLLYLADCYERAGRLASAWATFREGASAARAAGQTERADSGDARAQALHGRLSRLELRVDPASAALAGFELWRGGKPVPRELWGVPAPTDGGEWLLEASAPGAAPWSRKIVLRAEGDNLRIDVPPLARAEESSPPVEAAPVEPAVLPVTPPPPARDTAPAGETERTLGMVVAGVGLVGVGFGSYFGLRAISMNTDAKELCDGAVCRDPRGVELTEDARDAATVSNVAFGVGLAALAGGVVLYLTAPSARGNALSLSPRVGRRAGGLSLGAHF